MATAALTLCGSFLATACDVDLGGPPFSPRIESPQDGTVTNDPTPTISGDSGDGGRVQLLDDDGNVLGEGETIDEEFSITTVELEDGSHEIFARAILGRERSELSDSITITIDTTPPNAPVLVSPAEGDVLAERSVTIEGVAEPDSVVEVTLDGEVVDTDEVDAGGYFTFRTRLLEDGEHQVTAVAIDAVENRSEPSATLSFVTDATAPTRPVITAPADGDVTADPILEVRGTTDPGVDVLVRVVDGPILGRGEADGGGAFAITLVSPLGNGTHELEAVASDELGNESTPSEAVSVTVDTIAPAAPVITRPEADDILSSLSYASGDAESGALVEVYVDGSLAGGSQATFSSFTVPLDLDEGTHTLYAVATDRAGNESPRSREVSFTLDYTPPADPVVTLGTRYSTTGGRLPIEGTAEPGTTVTLTPGTVATTADPVGTVQVGSDGGFGLLTPPLDDGAHGFTVTVTDDAGLTSRATVWLTVDTVAPAAPTITGTPLGNLAGSTLYLSGTTELGSTVEIFLDGVPFDTAGSGSSTWALRTDSPDEGVYSVTAQATDLAGNVSDLSDPFELTVDRNPPVVDAGPDLLVNGPVMIDATVTDLTAVTYEWDTQGGTGTVTFSDLTVEDPTVSVDTDGVKGLLLIVTDAVGNVGYDTVVIRTDTMGPTLVSSSPDSDETGVDVGRTVRVLLSEPIDPASVAGNLVVDAGGVTGSVSVDPGGTVISFTPTTPLAGATAYQVDLLAGLTDLAGNPVTPTSFSFTTVDASVPRVEPLYVNGGAWNDYVEDDGPDPLHANDTRCDPDGMGDYYACLHGAVLRQVDTGDANCNGHVASDALDAFDWVCDDSGGSARMVSTGLKAGRHLSDLIDFAHLSWLPNAVTIDGAPGPDYPLTTGSAEWWSNDVRPIPDDGALDAAGTVYAADDEWSGFLEVTADRIAIVLSESGYVVPDTADPRPLLTAGAQSFLWLEGLFYGWGAGSAIVLQGTRMSVLEGVRAYSDADQGLVLEAGARRNLVASTVGYGGAGAVVLSDAHDNHVVDSRASSSAVGLSLEAGASGNQVTDVYLFRNTVGVRLFGAHANTLTSVAAVRNIDSGIWLESSEDNRLDAVSSIANGLYGVGMLEAHRTRVSGLRASSNLGVGLYFSQTSGASVAGAVVSSGGDAGIRMTNCDNLQLFDVTSVNNLDTGVVVSGGDNNVLANLVSVNNGVQGVELLGNANDNLLENLVSTENEAHGVSLRGASAGNRFTGVLKVGGNGLGGCMVERESNSGALFDDSGALDDVHDGDCIATGVSDFTPSTGVTAVASFVGKVGSGGPFDATEDDVNPSDDSSPGTSDIDLLVDWVSFENDFRVWGADGGAFPSDDNRGPPDQTWFYTRIWDFSAYAADDGDAGGPVLWSVLATPSGDDVIEHAWIGTAAAPADCQAVMPGSVWMAADDCRSTFLRDAVELSSDGSGNDNGLCESGERCLYTPNVGAYQGHGALQSTGPFSDGTVSGVDLQEHVDNGY